MSKRKVTSVEAAGNILQFVEADDGNNYFESDCEDELGSACNDLDEIYNDDRNAADENHGDNDEDEVEHKSSSDDDQSQPQPQLGNQLPQKM